MKSIRNSKKGELSSVGVLLIVAVVFGWYFFYGKGGIIDSDKDTMATLKSYQEELESQYLDTDGKVSEYDLDELLQEYYDKASDTKGVSECRLNDDCVAMELKDGTRYVYVPEIEGVDAGGDVLRITTYEPYCTEFYNADAYNTPFDDAARAIEDSNIEAFYFDSNYDDYSVTLDSILDMQQNKIIIWNGHGTYDSEYHSIICTGIEWDDDVPEKYRDDLVVLSLTSGDYVGIIADFFENNMEDEALEGSIIYLGTCSGARDKHLMETLEEKGARTVFGFSGKVHHSYDEDMATGIFADGLAYPDTSVFNAVANAKATYGQFDTGICEGTQLVTYGDDMYTLNEMINQYGPDFQAAPPEIQIDPQGDSFYDPDTYSEVADEDLIGYWTNDEYDDQPTVVQFYMAGGVLKYRMFSVVLGDGSGFGLANGHSIFEYNDGMTEYMENLESLFCYTSDESGIYIIFCCPDADEGVMTEKDYGETWYRWDDFPYQDLVDEHYGY